MKAKQLQEKKEEDVLVETIKKSRNTKKEHKFTFRICIVEVIVIGKVIKFQIPKYISAGADGGPRSRVCACSTLHSAPH